MFVDTVSMSSETKFRDDQGRVIKVFKDDYTSKQDFHYNGTGNP